LSARVFLIEKHLDDLEERVTDNTSELGRKAPRDGFIAIEGDLPVAGLYETFGS